MKILGAMRTHSMGPHHGLSHGLFNLEKHHRKKEKNQEQV